MALVRRNVFELGDDWADPILWYARAVGQLRKQPLAASKSWRFYAAIHGFNRDLWELVGYYSSGDKMPSKSDIDTYWNQCQHGSWYFLPWHRGYLMAFEALIRDEVVNLNGPHNWTLPYWNYFKPGQAKMPKAFGSPDWPDGRGNNPLYEVHRYGPKNDGEIMVPLSEVNMKALLEEDFVGVTSGGGTGFGGPDTGFEHGGRHHGAIETQPHDWVHGLVGGQSPDGTFPGLMSNPIIAGLDPIFWLHHANIDRLWESWLHSSQVHSNPDALNWINGPSSIGDRNFSMPKLDGTVWTYSPGDMADLSTLGYIYDELEKPVKGVGTGERLERLGLTAKGRFEMEAGKNVELIGANKEPLELLGVEARTTVTMNPEMRKKVMKSLMLPPGERVVVPDRMFLNLENVRGNRDSTAFHVYVGGRDKTIHGDPNHLAGSIALFGVTEASDPKGKHAGQGLTFTLDITDIVDALHLTDAFDVDKLDVHLVPTQPVDNKAKVTVGRVSIYRQGQ